MTDLNEEMRQIRTLIERGASADQAFRDVRHTVKSTASIRGTTNFSSSLFFCVSNIYLQVAEFNVVSMTYSGTRIFPMEQSWTGYTVINQNSLSQGRGEVMTFKGQRQNIPPCQRLTLVIC